MDVKIEKGFWKSFKRYIDGENPLRWAFWVEKYYDVKRGIKSLYHYFWVVTKMVPWDYSSILIMLKFQVKTLADYLDESGIEEETSRNAKVKKMRRFIELAENHLKDNYAERCGYNYKFNFKLVPVEDNPDLSYMETDETPEQQEANSKAIHAAHELEEKEWKEMINTLKDMRGWWD